MHELAEEIRSTTVPLRDAIESCLREKKADGIAENSLRAYRTALRHYRECVGGDVDVSEALKSETIQGFKVWGRNEKKWAPNTLNLKLQAVSILASHSLERGWIQTRPKIGRIDATSRMVYLERDEVNRYLDTLRPAFRTQQLLLISTGMRLGESEALEVRDIRGGDDGMKLKIRESKTRAGEREIFVPEWAAAALRDHIEQHGRSGRDSVFQISRRTVQREHRRACEEAEIFDYTIHDHRHTAAVALARVGTPMPRIRDHLGHENIERTMRYAEFHPEYGDVRPYFEKMGRRLGFASHDPSENGSESEPEAVMRTIRREVRKLDGSANGRRDELSRIVAELAEMVGVTGGTSGDSLGDTPSSDVEKNRRNALSA